LGETAPVVVYVSSSTSMNTTMRDSTEADRPGHGEGAV
jgi:hypothetical protein